MKLARNGLLMIAILVVSVTLAGIAAYMHTSQDHYAKRLIRVLEHPELWGKKQEGVVTTLYHFEIPGRVFEMSVVKEMQIAFLPGDTLLYWGENEPRFFCLPFEKLANGKHRILPGPLVDCDPAQLPDEHEIIRTKGPALIRHLLEIES